MCEGGFCAPVPDAAQIDGDGGGPPTGCGALTLLQDDFEGSTIGTEWWPWEDVGAEPSVSGGYFQIYVPAGSTDNLAGINSRTAFDLTGGAFDVEVAEVGGRLTIVEVRDGVSGGRVQTAVEEATLYAGVFGVSDPGTRIEIPYVPADHRYWRIREEAGDVIWELSGDRQQWSELHREPMPFPPEHVRGVVSGGDARLDASSYIRFGDVNLSAPSDLVYCAAEALHDEFAAATLGPLWEPYDDEPGCTIAPGGGDLVMSYAADDASAFCGIESAHHYDLRDSSFVIDAGQIPPDADNFVTYVEAGRFDDSSTYVGFALEANLLYVEQFVGGAAAGADIVPHDPAAHRYWRLRGGGGRVYLEVSPDGARWSALLDEPAAFDLSRVRFSIGAGYHAVSASVPLSVRVPAVNT